MQEQAKETLEKSVSALLENVESLKAKISELEEQNKGLTTQLNDFMNRTATPVNDAKPKGSRKRYPEFITYSFRGVRLTIPKYIVDRYPESLFSTVLSSKESFVDGAYYINCASTYIDDMINFMDFGSYRLDRYSTEEWKYYASDMEFMKLPLAKELFLELHTLSEYYGQLPKVKVNVSSRVYTLDREIMKRTNVTGYLDNLFKKKNAELNEDVFMVPIGTSMFKYVAEFINYGRIHYNKNDNPSSILDEFDTFKIVPTDRVLTAIGYKPNDVNFFFPNSTIMADRFLYKIRRWTAIDTPWKLVYSSETNIKTNREFHAHVDDQGEFIAFLRSMKAGLFGVYMPFGYMTAWKDNSPHLGDGSFVFTLSNVFMQTPFRLDAKKDRTNCIIYDRDHLFYLGPSMMGSDLEISFDRIFHGQMGEANLDGSHCYINKSGYGRSFVGGKAPLDDIGRFDIEDVEVYIPNP